MLKVFKKRIKQKVTSTDQPMAAPDIPGILPVLSVDKLLEAHTGRLNSLSELAGLSESNFSRLYKTPIQNFARLVQLLPASEVHHHSSPGGILTHTLDVCVYALKIRRSYVLSTTNNAEDVSLEQDIWTYAIFLAALCHDLAKPIVDQAIHIYDSKHNIEKWVSWVNYIDEQGDWYTCQFVKKRQYKLHEKASPLVLHKVVPSDGIEWLSSNQPIFMQWLATVSGDHESALSIGEIVTLADSQSVASNLGAESSQVTASVTQVKPLFEKIVTALRFLLSEGELPLNRNGAAGWIKGTSCWLVSKRTIDAIRDHLSKEGHTGIPAKNSRMFDVLQEHAILTPCGDKAIWKVAINGKDWSNELTVINIPVSKLWINQDNKPDDFEGEVIVSEEGNGSHEGDTLLSSGKDETLHENNIKKEKPVLSESKTGQGGTGAAIDRELGISSFLPTPIDQDSIDQPYQAPIKKIDQSSTTDKGKEEKAQIEASALEQEANKSVGDGNSLTLSNTKKQHIEEIVQKNMTAKSDGTLFFDWLQEGIQSGSIKTNAPKARVHVVTDGVIIVTPGVFQDYSVNRDVDWKVVQKIIFKQKLHTRDKKGLNVIKYEVKGQSRITTINAIHFQDSSIIFGHKEPPACNPHITKYDN